MKWRNIFYSPVSILFSTEIIGVFSYNLVILAKERLYNTQTYQTRDIELQILVEQQLWVRDYKHSIKLQFMYKTANDTSIVNL